MTQNGKGILCDGLWAQLTHPNYFGDVLQAVGWALLCGRLFIYVKSVDIIYIM